MPLGPIITRELVRHARTRRSYGKRTVVPITMVIAIGGNYWAWHSYNGGPNTVQEVSRFGRYLFAQFVLIQVATTAFLVPDLVARTIAEETDRKTLGFLLLTRLSSTSIVAGKLAAGLWHYLGCLLAGLPVVMMLPLLGGVEPGLVLLAYAGTASMALFLAGLSMFFSIVARRGRDAMLLAHALAGYWIGGTVAFSLPMPGLSPSLYRWLAPINNLLLASSPSAVLLNVAGVRTALPFRDVLVRMFALQLAGFSLLLVAAIAQLRPAYRRHADASPADRRRASRRRRIPPCGDLPIVWKERYLGRPRGFFRIVGALAWIAIATGTGVVLYHAGAVSAFQEALAWGYVGESPSHHRLKYNEAVRLLTVVGCFLYTLVVTAHTAEGIVIERARGTWSSLLATPLEARQLIRGKMFGACWRTRGLALLLVGLWSSGLLTGALHPLGFLAALVALIAATWFRAALGTYASLACHDQAGASNAAVVPVLLLDLSGMLVVWMPEPLRGVLLGFLSFPLINGLSLFSYEEVHSGLGAASFPNSGDFPIAAGEPGWHVVLTWGAGVVAMLLAALLIERRAIRHFDRLSGRPVRRAAAA